MKIAKKLLEDSLDAGKDFSKFMAQFSFGAIPIYISLMELTSPNKSLPLLADYNVVFRYLPILLLLGSGVLFVVSYYPKPGKIMINVVDTTRSAYHNIVRRRRILNTFALGLFILAIILASLVLM